MLAKVSYNAYASSANGVQRQNQPKDVNFGALNPEQLKALATLREGILKPSEVRGPGACNIFNTVQIHAGINALVEFLGFCQKKPQADAKGILDGIIKLMRIEQANPSYSSTIGRTGAFQSILECCKQCSDHSDLSAGEVFEGITKDGALARIQQQLSNFEVLVKK